MGSESGLQAGEKRPELYHIYAKELSRRDTSASKKTLLPVDSEKAHMCYVLNTKNKGNFISLILLIDFTSWLCI